MGRQGINKLSYVESWVIAGRIENTEYSVIEGIPNYRVYNAI
jgi:hypothetical protein